MNNESMTLSIFLLCSFHPSVNAPEDHQLSVKRFINSLESWAVDCVSPIGPSVVEEAVQQLVNLIAENEEDFHLLTTREDGMSCMDAKGPVSIPLRVSLYHWPFKVIASVIAFNTFRS